MTPLWGTIPPTEGNQYFDAVAEAREVAARVGQGRDLAESLHLSDRALLRWCERSHLPPPRRLLAWIRVLFAAELARRLAGTGVTSNSLHPGSVATNIWSGAPLWAKPLILLLYRPFFLSVEKGAATIVQLAASPELEGVTGKYFEKGKPVAPAPLARDEALAKRLWKVSADLVGLPE